MIGYDTDRSTVRGDQRGHPEHCSPQSSTSAMCSSLFLPLRHQLGSVPPRLPLASSPLRWSVHGSFAPATNKRPGVAFDHCGRTSPHGIAAVLSAGPSQLPGAPSAWRERLSSIIPSSDRAHARLEAVSGLMAAICVTRAKLRHSAIRQSFTRSALLAAVVDRRVAMLR